MMNEKIIENLTVTGKRYAYVSDQLELVVSSKGKKTFYMKARYNGRSIHKKIGDYPEVSVKQAELVKNQELLKFRLGIGSEETPEENATDFAKTEFGVIFKDWYRSKLPSWRSKSKYLIETVYKKYIKEALEKLPLKDIKSPNIYSLLIRIDSSVQQKRVLSIVRSAIDYAVNIGYIDRNPCDKLSQVLAKREESLHYQSIPYQELNQWIKPMLSFKKAEWNRYVLFSLCSLLRPNENVSLTWGDVDFENRVITIPAERMKAKRPHRVPITEQMMNILQSQMSQYPVRTLTDRIFFPELSPAYVLHRIQNIFRRKQIPTVLHGFRSTGRTWLADQEDPALMENMIPFSVAESCLAHAEQSEVVRAYKRTDYLPQRRLAMQRWNDFIGYCMQNSVDSHSGQIENHVEKMRLTM